MTCDLARDLLCWIKQQQHPFAFEKPAEVIPSIEPVIVEQPNDVESVKSDVHTWAETHITLCRPITPLLCLDVHPFLEKVVDALTKSVATASLIKRSELEEIGFETLFTNPFLQFLLVPIEEIEANPLLHARLPNPEPHCPKANLFPLWSIETYLNDQKKKRDLWESLKRLPLSY